MGLSVNTPAQPRTVVFIVRVWAEYLGSRPPKWRGVLETVENGQQTPFTDLDEIAEIIQAQTHSILDTEGKK